MVSKPPNDQGCGSVNRDTSIFSIGRHESRIVQAPGKPIPAFCQYGRSVRFYRAELLCFVLRMNIREGIRANGIDLS